MSINQNAKKNISNDFKSKINLEFLYLLIQKNVNYLIIHRVLRFFFVLVYS